VVGERIVGIELNARIATTGTARVFITAPPPPPPPLDIELALNTCPPSEEEEEDDVEANRRSPI